MTRRRTDLAALRLTILRARRQARDWTTALKAAEALPPGPARERRIESACRGLALLADRLLALEAL